MSPWNTSPVPVHNEKVTNLLFYTVSIFPRKRIKYVPCVDSCYLWLRLRRVDHRTPKHLNRRGPLSWDLFIGRKSTFRGHRFTVSQSPLVLRTTLWHLRVVCTAMSRLRLVYYYLWVTVYYLRVTLYYLRFTLYYLRVTIYYLRVVYDTYYCPLPPMYTRGTFGSY